MSTNSQPVRFQFDAHFGEPEPVVDEGPDLEAEWRAKADRIREDALAEGRVQGEQAGRDATLSSLEAQVAQLLQTLSNRLDALIMSQEEARERLERQAAKAAVAIAQQMAPAAVSQWPLAEVEALIARSLEEVRPDAQLSVKVAPSLVEPLESRLSTLLDAQDFTGHVQVRGEPAMAVGDACIEWDESGFEFDQARLGALVAEALQRFSGEAGADGPNSNSMTQEGA